MTRFGPCEIPDEQVRAFLDRHGLSTERLEPLTSQAVVNWVFLADDFVLRINKPEIETDDAYTELVAVPAVRAAGIDTPELLVFDDSRAIIDSVVTVYRRAPGVALGRISVSLSELPGMYRQLGREVFRIQSLVTDVPDPGNKLDPFEVANPREALARERAQSHIDQVSADWINLWLDDLETALIPDEPKVFAHQDLHAFNTLVETNPLKLQCVIDWGDAGWAPTYEDFNAVPVWAVPWMIDGYESEGGKTDEGFLGRVILGAIESALTWRDFEGEEPWAPKIASFWANLVRLSNMDLPHRHRRWLPAHL